MRKPALVSDKPRERETPSLFKRKSKEAKQEDTAVQKVEKTESFTEEALQEAWKKFQGLQVERSSTEASVIKRKVSKLDGAEVAVSLSSSLEITIFERIELEVVSFLRKELQNDQIAIIKQVEEFEETKKLYTSKDIFEYMVQINPAVKTLKDKLGLDFEY